MYAIPYLCHTQIAITSKITDHSEPSALGYGIHGFADLFGGTQHKNVLMIQRQAGITKVRLTQGHLKHVCLVN